MSAGGGNLSQADCSQSHSGWQIITVYKLKCPTCRQSEELRVDDDSKLSPVLPQTSTTQLHRLQLIHISLVCWCTKDGSWLWAFLLCLSLFLYSDCCIVKLWICQQPIRLHHKNIPTLSFANEGEASEPYVRLSNMRLQSSPQISLEDVKEGTTF